MKSACSPLARSRPGAVCEERLLSTSQPDLGGNAEESWKFSSEAPPGIVDLVAPGARIRHDILFPGQLHHCKALESNGAQP